MLRVRIPTKPAPWGSLAQPLVNLCYRFVISHEDFCNIVLSQLVAHCELALAQQLLNMSSSIDTDRGPLSSAALTTPPSVYSQSGGRPWQDQQFVETL